MCIRDREESAKKYIPVKLEEFCGNWIRKLKEEEQWMRENLPDIKEAEEGYITIEGDANIRDKLHNLIRNAAERVYISGTGAVSYTHLYSGNGILFGSSDTHQ